MKRTFMFPLILFLLVAASVVVAYANEPPVVAAPNVDDPIMAALTGSRDVYAAPLCSPFTRPTLVTTGIVAASGDFNNDGEHELLTVRHEDRKLRMYTGGIKTGFTESVVSENAYPASAYGIKRSAADPAVADFDNNGFLDFAFTSCTCGDAIDPLTNDCHVVSACAVQIHLNQGNNKFNRVAVPGFDILGKDSEALTAMDSGDFNGDGDQDMIVQHYWSSDQNHTHLLLGDGSGSVFSNTIALEATSSLGLVAGDFNNDGFPDMILGQDDDDDAGQTWLYLNDGSGTFTLAGEAYDTNPAVEQGRDNAGYGYPGAYDFDGDGNVDIVAPAMGIGLLRFSGNGAGGFEREPVVDYGTDDWLKVSTPPGSCPEDAYSRLQWIHVPLIFKQQGRP